MGALRAWLENRKQRRAKRAIARRDADPQPYLERLADTHVDQFTKDKGPKD